MRPFDPGVFELKSMSYKDLHPFDPVIIEFWVKKSTDNSQPLVAKQLTATKTPNSTPAKWGQHGAAIVASRLQTTTCEQRTDDRQ